jgi:hypothetical protein
MILSNNLVFLDTETTGLTLEHDVWEIALAEGDGEVLVYQVPHSLRNADPKALELNGYRARINNLASQLSVQNDLLIASQLQGKTIVGANPSFDAYRLERRWGRAPWHYRLIDVESMAVPIFNLNKPFGLKGLVEELTARGFEIPENDHTAAGDVKTVRAVYKALMYLGGLAR